MKYITFTENSGAIRFVLFSDQLTHSTVADSICRGVKEEPEVNWLQPRSAGFYSIDGVSVYGRSESMNLDSQPADAAYIYLGDAVAFMEPEIILATLEQIKGLFSDYEKG